MVYRWRTTTEDDEDIYKSLREKDKLTQRAIVHEDDTRDLEDRKTKKIVAHRATQRLEEKKIEELEMPGVNVIGTLFDRVKFLEDRIRETNMTIEERKTLHQQMVEEIAEDIREKEAMEAKVMDLDERRNIRLDISVLRKERRHESLQYWKDLLALRQELRELMEKHETEEKIASLFGKEKTV